MAETPKLPVVVMDTYDKTLNYAEVTFQRGRDVGDWELNEAQKNIRNKLNKALSLTDTNAVFFRPDGAVNSPVLASVNPNECFVNAGWYLLDGQPYYLEANTTVPLPAPPGVAPDRLDYIYLTLTEDSFANTDVEHPEIGETAIRRKLEVTPGVSSGVLPPTGSGGTYEGSTRDFVIGAVIRPVGDPNVTQPQCLNLTKKAETNNVQQRLALTYFFGIEGRVYWEDGQLSLNLAPAAGEDVDFGIPGQVFNAALGGAPAIPLSPINIADGQCLVWNNPERYQFAGGSSLWLDLTAENFNSYEFTDDGTNQNLDSKFILAVRHDDDLVWVHNHVRQLSGTVLNLRDTNQYNPSLARVGSGAFAKTADASVGFGSAQVELSVLTGTDLRISAGVLGRKNNILSIPADIDIDVTVTPGINFSASGAYFDSNGDNYIWLDSTDLTATGLQIDNTFVDRSAAVPAHLFVGFVHIGQNVANPLLETNTFVRNLLRKLNADNPVLTVNPNTLVGPQDVESDIYGDFNSLGEALAFCAYAGEQQASGAGFEAGFTIKLLPGRHSRPDVLTEPYRFHGIRRLTIEGSGGKEGTQLVNPLFSASNYCSGVTFRDIEFYHDGVQAYSMFELGNMDDATDTVGTPLFFYDCKFTGDALNTLSIFNAAFQLTEQLMRIEAYRCHFNTCLAIFTLAAGTASNLKFHDCIITVGGVTAPSPFVLDATPNSGAPDLCQNVEFVRNTITLIVAANTPVIQGRNAKNFLFKDNKVEFAGTGNNTGPIVSFLDTAPLLRSENIVIDNNYIITPNPSVQPPLNSSLITININVGGLPDASLSTATTHVHVTNNHFYQGSNGYYIPFVTLVGLDDFYVANNNIDKRVNQSTLSAPGLTANIGSCQRGEFKGNRFRGLSTAPFIPSGCQDIAIKDTEYTNLAQSYETVQFGVAAVVVAIFCDGLTIDNFRVNDAELGNGTFGFLFCNDVLVKDSYFRNVGAAGGANPMCSMDTCTNFTIDGWYMNNATPTGGGCVLFGLNTTCTDIKIRNVTINNSSGFDYGVNVNALGLMTDLFFQNIRSFGTNYGAFMRFVAPAVGIHDRITVDSCFVDNGNVGSGAIGAGIVVQDVNNFTLTNSDIFSDHACLVLHGTAVGSLQDAVVKNNRFKGVTNAVATNKAAVRVYSGVGLTSQTSVFNQGPVGVVIAGNTIGGEANAPIDGEGIMLAGVRNIVVENNKIGPTNGAGIYCSHNNADPKSLLVDNPEYGVAGADVWTRDFVVRGNLITEGNLDADINNAGLFVRHCAAGDIHNNHLVNCTDNSIIGTAPDPTAGHIPFSMVIYSKSGDSGLPAGNLLTNDVKFIDVQGNRVTNQSAVSNNGGRGCIWVGNFTGLNGGGDSLAYIPDADSQGWEGGGNNGDSNPCSWCTPGDHSNISSYRG